MLRYRTIFHTLLIVFLIMTYVLFPSSSSEAQDEQSTIDPFEELKALLDKAESITHIPWYYLAAINQYEKSILTYKQLEARKQRLIYMTPPASVWFGFLNPNKEDTQPESIQFFGGIGIDGDGDGLVSLESDADLLYSVALFITEYGTTEEDIAIGLWEYYQSSEIVKIIQEFAKIYRHHDSLNLHATAFPFPKRSNYSYTNTWGNPRGWGGQRIHEGTDLFANYGTPVRSTTYGYVEVIGWNNYGGWRVGIRDLNNIYHYYAHLSGFQKGIEVGTIVEPGQVIGYVGSSGYGTPGTSGKFIPHLHYGMYKFNGKNEWAINPYPYLRQWERKNR